MVKVPEALELLGGFASRDELIGMRCWPETIDMALYYRKILRVRRGQYASLDTPPAILRALRVGGRLACVSALAFYAGREETRAAAEETGAAAEETRAAAEGAAAAAAGPDAKSGRDDLHILVKQGASRLGVLADQSVVVHWTRRDVEGTRMVVSERVARAQAASCGDAMGP
ncbi:MAG: hypothetical protein JWN36_2433 [Microbacteriaceae bacterium]|nr:hypothetical protein [Microbacteriaceae bacterium]